MSILLGGKLLGVLKDVFKQIRCLHITVIVRVPVRIGIWETPTMIVTGATSLAQYREGVG